MLIGFGYKAGVGKDEAADYLVDSYGFIKKRFAGNLKDCCMRIFNLSKAQVYDEHLKQESLAEPVCFCNAHYGKIIKHMSESLNTEVVHMPYLLNALSGTYLRTPRDVLQFVGTDIMRAHYDNYHVDVCFAGMLSSVDYVISDVRFCNEAEAVLKAGGHCVKVSRDTRVLPSKNKLHKSEVDLDSWSGWSAVLDNTKTGIVNLHSNIDILLEKLNVRRLRNKKA